METALTENDKKLLYILGFIVIAFIFGWLIIRPIVKNMNEADENIKVEQELKIQNEQKVMGVESAESLMSRFQSDYDESVSRYYEPMDSSEIDRMVTSYVLKSGLFAESLNIKMPSGSVEERPYAYSKITSSHSSSTATANNSDAETLLVPYDSARNNANSTSSSGVQCVALSLSMTGSQAACQAMIDDLCTKPSVRITGFSWEKLDPVERLNPTTGLYEYVDSGKVRLKLDVNLYMADFADYEVAGVEG